MPSWNIHTAHVERLLREEGAEALGIRDVNAFLFGNVAPDVLVGYMVPNPTHRIDYKLTHLALREHIPLPRYDEFWDFYIRPGAGAPEPTDLVLGAWCHLVADHVYNAHTREFLAERGIEPGEAMRIAKQGDFALFGHTLVIGMKPEVTPELLAVCAAFPQYSLAEADVRAAVDVAGRIVDENCATQIHGEPDYALLTSEFFADAREEANATMVSGLKRYAANH